VNPYILYNINQLGLWDIHDLTVFMNLYAKYAENKNWLTNTMVKLQENIFITTDLNLLAPKFYI